MIWGSAVVNVLASESVLFPQLDPYVYDVAGHIHALDKESDRHIKHQWCSIITLFDHASTELSQLGNLNTQTTCNMLRARSQQRHCRLMERQFEETKTYIKEKDTDKRDMLYSHEQQDGQISPCCGSGQDY